VKSGKPTKNKNRGGPCSMVIGREGKKQLQWTEVLGRIKKEKGGVANAELEKKT